MEKIKPHMLSKCKCRHTFEEHDWGAYDNPEWMPACLVEGCGCSNFEPPKREEIQNKLKQYCRESECGEIVAGCSKDVDCQPRACWYWESLELALLFS